MPGPLPGQGRGRAGPGWLLLTCAHVRAYMHMHAHTRNTAGEELFFERVVRKNYSSPAHSATTAPQPAAAAAQPAEVCMDMCIDTS